jgi:hypothetical protein
MSCAHVPNTQQIEHWVGYIEVNKLIDCILALCERNRVKTHAVSASYSRESKCQEFDCVYTLI